MDAPSLVSAWDALVQQHCCVFSAPTARTWQQIALGWILNGGSATVTAIFRTLGDQADRHWTVYEKFFYQAAWCLSALCTALLQRVGEQVTDLYLAEGKKRERLWTSIAGSLAKLKVPASRIKRLTDSDDAQQLAKLLQELLAKA